jgi:hypothetical protein
LTDAAALKREAWSRGLLGWKLLPHQYQLDEAINAAAARPEVSVYVMECARRFGKTTTLLKNFLEWGLRNKRWQMRWAATTAQSCREFVHPIMAELTADCPSDLRPQWRTKDGCYIFPSTGAQLYVRGTDSPRDRERLRGTRCDRGAIDEAGYVHEVEYILKSILLPQTLTCGGKIFLLSNAPKSPQHEFCAIADEAKLEGRYSKLTIDDNTHMTDAQRVQAERDSGGRESTTFRREYLCERVTDSNLAIVPEWREAKGFSVQEFSPTNDKLGIYHHRYRSLDHGLGKDLTACLWGYYNFPEARLYIEDERQINGPKMTTEGIAELVREVEAARPEYRSCHRSVADNNNPLLLADLGSTHGIHFTPVGEGSRVPGMEQSDYLAGRPKENLDAMVNQMRLFISGGRLVVHPRCQYLLLCLEGGLWEEKKRMWSHHKKLGHYDHLAALMYLIRALDEHSNPIPANLNVHRATHHVPDHIANPPRHDSSAWAEMITPHVPDWD